MCDNTLPLNLTLLSAKLRQANYTSHFIGKGHLGYQARVCPRSRAASHPP